MRVALAPVLTIIGTAALMFAIAPGVNVDALSRGVVGPTTWPKIMMLGVIVCASVYFMCNVLVGRKADQRSEAASSKHPDAFQILDRTGSADSFEELPRDVAPEEYDNRKAAAGILVVVAYGFGIPIIGFGPATVACIILLLRIGGMRRLVTTGLIGVVGTVALLYLFVKVTAMPLDRGVGHFNDLNLKVYKVLGIY